MGYYLDRPYHDSTTDVVKIVLNDLIISDTPLSPKPKRRHRARRHRLPNGKQRRRPKGRTPSTTHNAGTIATPTDHIDELGTIANDTRWWVPKGLWAIETCNGNSWDSLERHAHEIQSGHYLGPRNQNIVR